MASKREREQREKRKRKSAGEWANEQDRTYEPTTVKLPEGKKFLTLRPGIMRLDVIPYVVGDGNPAADKGYVHFERVYFCYKIPMPNGKTQRYTASWDTFGHKDFVAEWVRNNGGSADKQLLDALRPQRRHLFNVIDVTDETEKKKGIQVFDTTFGSVKYPAFGKMLKDKIQMSKRYGNFDDPENGLTVIVKVEEDSFPGGKFNRITSLDFDQREEQYEDSIIDEAICFDECLIETPYETMKKIFLMGQGEEVEEKDTPAPSKNGHVKAKDEDGDELDEDDELEEGEAGDDDPTAADLDIVRGSKVTYRKKEWEVRKVSGDGTSLTLEDDEGEQERGVAPGDVKLLKEEKDEDEEEVGDKLKKLAAKANTAHRKVVELEEDEEDELDEDDELEEDEDEEEEPAPKKKKRVG